MICFRNQEVQIDMRRKARCLEKKAKGVLPKNPVTCNDVLSCFQDNDIMNNFGYSLHNEKHLFYNGLIETPTYSFCVFSSKMSINLMQSHIPIERRHILMDATFKIVPIGPFNQLLIIYVNCIKKVFRIVVFF